jgi:hypothetical protein
MYDVLGPEENYHWVVDWVMEDSAWVLEWIPTRKNSAGRRTASAEQRVRLKKLLGEELCPRAERESADSIDDNEGCRIPFRFGEELRLDE